jgi:hypothetical protein
MLVVNLPGQATFSGCISSSAQALLLPNLPRRFGVFFPGPLACLQCWREPQLLTQVCNCSQINHVPGYQWTAAWQLLAWQTWSHPGQRNSCRGNSQSQPGPCWQEVFLNQLKLSRSVSCCQHGHQVNSSRLGSCQDQWRHGQCRGRGGTRAGRLTPARRYCATPV